MGNGTSHNSSAVKCTPVEITNKCVLGDVHFDAMCKTVDKSEENYTYSYYQSKTKDSRNEKNGNVQNIDINLTCEVDNLLAKQLCKLDTSKMEQTTQIGGLFDQSVL